MSKFLQYLTERVEILKISCCTIHSQRELASLTGSFTITLKDDDDAEDLFDDKDCLPNNGPHDIEKILAAVRAGKIWVGDDIYGEGVVAFGPADKMPGVKMAASKLYKENYGYNGSGR